MGEPGNGVELLVELRTHGVSGTPPTSILGADHVIQVAGDNLGRFFRPATSDAGSETIAAPAVEAAGRAVPRLLEAYHWGNLTSGGWRKATWALLFPFALVNIAQWTLPQAHRGAARPFLGYPIRGLMRLLALGLTVLFAVQAEVITADLYGTQCLAPITKSGSNTCLGSVSVLRVLRDHPLSRSLAAAAVLVLLGAAIWYVTRDDLEAKVTTSGPMPEDASQPAIASDAFLAKQHSNSLYALHAMAAFGVAAIVLAGGGAPRDGAWNHVTYVVGLVLALLAAMATFLLNDPSGGWGQSRLIRLVFGKAAAPWLWSGLAAANFVALAATAGARTVSHDPGRLRAGENEVLNELMPALGLCCLVVLLLAIGLAIAARADYRDGDEVLVPTRFRPWLGGLLAPFAAALAALLAGGLGTAASVLAQNCAVNACKPASLSTPSHELVQPPIYDAVALLWGMTAVAVIVLSIPAVIIGWAWSTRAKWHAAAVRVQGRATDGPWFVGNAKWGAQYVLAALTGIAVVAGAIALVTVDAGAAQPPWLHDIVGGLGPVRQMLRSTSSGVGLRKPVSGDPTGVVERLQALGVLILVLAVVALLKAVRTASRNPGEARNLAIMWDIMSFWPAEAHPLVPPGYAQRAVPDLQARVQAHLDVPGTRVVLCGHSQGSLIAYTVALRVGRSARGRFGLVTHGSQLQWIFPRVFPSLLNYPAHQDLMRDLGGRWHNVVRFTDPAGGPVLSWQLAAAPITADVLAADGTTARATEQDACHGARILGNEHWLPDPVLPDPGPLSPVAAPGQGQNLTSQVHGHSDYPTDRHWPCVIASAAGLDAEAP